MDTVQITQLNPEDLEELIARIIHKSLANIRELNQKQEWYITRKQLAEELQITLPTVSNLTKRGILKAYHLEGRVYFKWSEVVEVIEKG